MVIKDRKILLGKRKGAHDQGTWSFPGGHLEFNEEVFNCAIREVKEETGLKINNLRVGPYTNDFFTRDDKHYITLYVLSDWESGVPQVLEKDRCETWEWFNWDELPSPLMTPLKNLMLSGYNPG